MATRRARRSQPAPAPIDLALQGGGSHGAFTWGVLDRLLQDETLAIDGVSGTSAGALNAAVMASGWAEGGREGARQALRDFWVDVSAQGGCFGSAGVAWPGAWGQNPLAALGGLAAFNLDRNPFYAWTQNVLRLASPYQFNPFDLNPLRDVVQAHVRQDALRSGPLSLFITATAVRSGQPRVFDKHDLSIDALLASACLPQLFKRRGNRTVSRTGTVATAATRPLWPLIYRNSAGAGRAAGQDQPAGTAPTLPDTPAEIADRVNEITFNAGLVA
jgi:NTE family protein